jgi:hypothetical protein
MRDLFALWREGCVSTVVPRSATSALGGQAAVKVAAAVFFRRCSFALFVRLPARQKAKGDQKSDHTESRSDGRQDVGITLNLLRTRLRIFHPSYSLTTHHEADRVTASGILRHVYLYRRIKSNRDFISRHILAPLLCL